VNVTVNGELVDLPEGATVADVVARTAASGERGIAVAVDTDVVPRSEWQDTMLTEGQRIELLAAIQGG
jgi:sulfur carrier protein